MVDFEEHRRANVAQPQAKPPVVVIDPEDIKTARRLWEAYENENLRGSTFMAEAMQAALRSLLEPPKPPKPVEPLGLGAVVEDAHGDRWVRIDESPYPWHCDGEGDSQWRHIDPVTVLSPGVPDGEV